MSMINKGIPYFPTPANFFDEEIMELLEAKFGILSAQLQISVAYFCSIGLYFLV